MYMLRDSCILAPYIFLTDAALYARIFLYKSNLVETCVEWAVRSLFALCRRWLPQGIPPALFGSELILKGRILLNVYYDSSDGGRPVAWKSNIEKRGPTFLRRTGFETAISKYVHAVYLAASHFANVSVECFCTVWWTQLTLFVYSVWMKSNFC
jgi:hypothetical protein